MRITADLQGILLTLALSGTQAAAGQDYGSKELLESLNCVGVEFVDCRLLDPSHRAECGISVEPVYIGEVFTNTRGGISTDEATRYQALLDLPLTLDLEKLDVPVPGTFFLLAQNTHGRGLTEDFVGDAQVLSNIDSFDNIMQVSEYWWEFGLCDDDVVVRLGKQDLNTEFLLMQSASDFIHSSFGLTPAAEVPSYPNAGMAAVLLANLTPSLRLKVGIWDTVVDGGTWGFSGNNVKLSIGELDYDYAVSDGRLPGTLALGIAYSSAGLTSKGAFPSVHGYYIQVEQLVFREDTPEDGDPQGLGLFVQYFPSFLNGDVPIPVISEDLNAGVVYKGLVDGRNEDVVGAGIAWARLDQGGTNQETAVEVFYRARITPSLSIQPDIQYIATPSGVYPDALVVGIRFQLDY